MSAPTAPSRTPAATLVPHLAARAAGVPRTLLNANRLWVDNPVRALAQRLVEVPVLLALGGPVSGGRLLEIGTGRLGTGLRLALGPFQAATADGIELYAASVEATRRRTADLGDRVSVQQADATALPAADGSYDAVLCFHLLHHAGDWRAAVAEAARVLRPGGQLYIAEMTARFVDSRLLRTVSHHPADGDRPTPKGVEAACRAAGLEIVGSRERYLGCWVAVVARRP